MTRTGGEQSQAGGRQGRYIGRSLPRFEDLRLVRGAGKFTDDFVLEHQAYAVFVRSPHAHARIVGVDSAAARALPGVLAVLTGADYVADGCGGVPQMPVPAGIFDISKPAFEPTPARGILDLPQFPFAIDKARFVGEAVAIVVAESVAIAKDAAELVSVEYEVLAPVVDMRTAASGPAIWDDAPDNIALEAEIGDRAAVERALAAADVVVEQEFINQRVTASPMEPRAAIGAYDPATDQYFLLAGTQSAHRQRHAISVGLKLKPEQLRVLCPDVGGGFGARSNPQPEHTALVWAAKRAGRPVKWTCDRSEAFLTDYQGRDLITRARLALSRDGRILALATDLTGNIGAATVAYVPLNNGAHIAPSVYDVPLVLARVRAMVTNTVPTAPYRGAGRPEAMLVMERLLDLAAERLGLDRLEIRRRNLVPLRRLPYRTATGFTYDSGDFVGNMEQALKLADWNGASARRADAQRRGRLHGIGVANYVESPVGAPHERVEIRVTPTKVELAVGTQSTGQGHETTFAQVMADQLGVTPDDIAFTSGDTAAIASGGGSHSDRSMRLAGALMVEASGKVIETARGAAAALLGVEPSSVAFNDGLFVAPQTNRRLTIFDVAREIESGAAVPFAMRKPLAATATLTGRIPAHPTGCAVCELEIDPETGAVTVTRYTTVDDGGQPINPMILDGQVHGGIAQGVGQSLTEAIVWAPETGDMLSGSFLDYAMPRADQLPGLTVELTEHPTKGSPLRVKGGGEAGVTPCLGAVMNAVHDALKPLGVVHIDMPATPFRVWDAIDRAGRR